MAHYVPPMADIALPEIPVQADERTTLEAFLDFYRASLVERTHDLTGEQLNRRHPPTTLTLARLLGHMALVEYTWFRERMAGGELPEPYQSLDWDADIDAEMTEAGNLEREELLARFDAAVADSRACAAAVDSLDEVSVGKNRAGEQWNLRWILVHMIEEYARHCGHADLIRESIDGDLAP